MASDDYTSVNVLREQHADLKRIADFRNIKITELTVQIADAYIKDFMVKHGDSMREMVDIEKRMAELRAKVQIDS